MHLSKKKNITKVFEPSNLKEYRVRILKKVMFVQQPKIIKKKQKVNEF